MRLILCAILFLLVGCGSNPIYFDDLHGHKAKNKYCLLLKGHNSTFDGTNCPNDQLDGRSVAITDQYINNDIAETMLLAESKGYSCTIISSVKAFEEVIDALSKKSDDSTQLLVAMSGECDDKGFIFNLVHTSGGMNLVPPGMKLLAKEAIARIGLVKGTKALVINGCQSGCFADAARQDSEFKGVVIAACAVGYATTECQRTGTSAVYAGFLGLYRDDPQTIKNLSTAEISAGFWFENLRHKISDIGAGGLPISYNPVIFSTAEFLF